MKSLPSARTIASYAEVAGGEVWLINANIPEFSHGNRFNHEPRRPRKLLLNTREINKLHAAVARQGMTLVPTRRIFQRTPGARKVELALAKGEGARQALIDQGTRLEARQAAIDEGTGMSGGSRATRRR